MNVYDFDKTIYYNDSTSDFYVFCLKRHPSIAKHFPKTMLAFVKYLLRINTKTQFKEVMYEFLHELRSRTPECIDRLIVIPHRKYIHGISRKQPQNAVLSVIYILEFVNTDIPESVLPLPEYLLVFIQEPPAH